MALPGTKLLAYNIVYSVVEALWCVWHPNTFSHSSCSSCSVRTCARRSFLPLPSSRSSIDLPFSILRLLSNSLSFWMLNVFQLSRKNLSNPAGIVLSDVGSWWAGRLLLLGSSRKATRFHRGLHDVFPTVVVATLTRFASPQSDSPRCSLSVPCSRSWALDARIPCALPTTVGVVFWPFASLHPRPPKQKS